MAHLSFVAWGRFDPGQLIGGPGAASSGYRPVTVSFEAAHHSTVIRKRYSCVQFRDVNMEAARAATGNFIDGAQPVRPESLAADLSPGSMERSHFDQGAETGVRGRSRRLVHRDRSSLQGIPRTLG
jgi:hypothetical protein